MNEGLTSEAYNHGAGQSVSIVIGDKLGKWILAALVIIILMLFWTNRVSTSAELKANQAVKASENMETELRMAQFWIQRTKADLDAKGIQTQPLPAAWGSN